MNGNSCVLDTGVIIDFFQSADSSAFRCLEFLETQGIAFYVTEITEMELLAFPGMTAKEEEELKLFLQDVNVLPMNGQIKEIAIALRRKTRRKLPDAIIAATAVCLRAPLVTGDKALAATVFKGFRAYLPDRVLEKGFAP